MSIERNRKVAYSNDIRWRIVWQVTAMNLPYRTVSANLNVSVGTVSNIIQRYNSTGEIEATKQPPRESARKLDELHANYLLRLLSDYPSFYLHELCDLIEENTGVEVSKSTVLSVLKRYGYTRKVVHQIPAEVQADTRARFIANVSFFSASQFVWIDETGCNNKDHIRKFGYSFKGTTPSYHRITVRGSRLSGIAAITTNGILAYTLTTDIVNGEHFLNFLAADLIPQMTSFDGSDAPSVIIMDNCSIHHTSEVRSFLNDVGVPVLYLPPYSPDLNPIEELFSYIKHYLVLHDDLIQVIRDKTTVVTAAFDSITPQVCVKWIEHAGYI